MDTRKPKTEAEVVSIKVCVRFRPANESEEQALSLGKVDNIVRFVSNTIQIQDPINPLVFTFDHLFLPNTSQLAIFNQIGVPAIEDIFEGYNSTIFAYGATGSGKTFTMMGSLYEENQKGIIPRIADLLTSNATESFKTVSCIEIYREQIRDLIASGPNSLKIKENNEGIIVEGMAKECFKTKDELLRVFEAAEKMRAVAATKMNRHSSRSHFLLVVEVVQILGNGSKIKGKLNLIDLAGSEKIHKSEISGINIEEAKKINLSLTALGKVICALSTNAKHVPYRDSKLTRLLQDSLGGNAKTTLIVNCSQLSCSIDEILSSLRFAQRAKTIKNSLRMNKEINMVSELKLVKLELSKTQKELKRLKNYSLGEISQLTEKTDENYVKSLEMQVLENENIIMQAEFANKELKRNLKAKKENVNSSVLMWKLINLKQKNEKSINDQLGFKNNKLGEVLKKFKEIENSIEQCWGQADFIEVNFSGYDILENKRELMQNPSTKEIESLYIQAENMEKKLKKAIKFMNWRLFYICGKNKILSQECVCQQLELKQYEGIIENLRKHLKLVKEPSHCFLNSQKQSMKLLQSKLDIIKSQSVLAETQTNNGKTIEKCSGKVHGEIKAQAKNISNEGRKEQEKGKSEVLKKIEGVDTEIKNTEKLLVNWIEAVRDKQKLLGIDSQEIEEMLLEINSIE